MSPKLSEIQDVNLYHADSLLLASN